MKNIDILSIKRTPIDDDYEAGAEALIDDFAERMKAFIELHADDPIDTSHQFDR